MLNGGKTKEEEDILNVWGKCGSDNSNRNTGLAAFIWWRFVIAYISGI